MRNIREKRIDTKYQIDAGVFEEVRRVFNQAIDIGYIAPAGDNDFIRQLKTNADVFAAFKTHRMGRDIASRLLDDQGNVKSFEQFRTDTAGIVDHHVNSWLRTEYDTAIKRAHRVAEMRQFISEADVFPNIEWLPSTAVNPRESHMPFYHHIWAADDPFWEHHKPGDEWGCQCHWASTDEPTTDNSGLGDVVAPPSPGLGGNPARTGQIFSDDHPYFPSDCAHCAFKGRQLSLFSNKTKDCYNCANVTKAIQVAKDEAYAIRIKAQKESFLSIRNTIKNKIGYKAELSIPKGYGHGTGILKITPDSVKNCLRSYKHTPTVDSKKCMLDALQHPMRLKHIEWKLLGANKDLNNPKDALNIAKKIKRGVVAYNYYEYKFNDKVWVLGFEEMADGFEQMYFVALKS